MRRRNAGFYSCMFKQAVHINCLIDYSAAWQNVDKAIEIWQYHHNKHHNNILAPLMYTELQFTHLKLRPCHIVSPSDSTVLFSEIGLELFVTWRSIGKMEDDADVTSFEVLLSIFTGKLKPRGL